MATAFSPQAGSSLLDGLLADVAHKVQLSPTDYGLAVDRYETIEGWLRRDDSALKDFLTRLYPQGSMAIGATIASRLKNDEFDVDVIAELSIRADSPPSVVLDTLFEALNGKPGSRYHGKVVRRSRCVTVEYDRMHIDVTPAVLLPDQLPRTSVIYHAHEDEPATEHRHIVANPWGFAQWFIKQTPSVAEIVDAFVRKSSDPVPDQETIRDKSKQLLSLQLLKRWRNKCYDARDGRCPPSIVLAHFVANHQARALGLFDELLSQSRNLQAQFVRTHANFELVAVQNPTCPTDILTDRWPADLGTQRVFVDDLNRLVQKLEYLQQRPTLDRCSEVFRDLFGESVTRVVVEDFQKRFRDGAYAGTLRHDGSGLALAGSGLAPTTVLTGTSPIKRHTDFGS